MLTANLNQIGCITLDNASNCDTMMAGIEDRLRREGIPFHRDGNHIRYKNEQVYTQEAI